MKKAAIFLFLAIISAVMMAIPEARAAENNETEDSVFQKASDVIKGKYEVKTVPFKEITVFQMIADQIGEVERADINPASK